LRRGHVNRREAIRGIIEDTNPEGKRSILNQQTDTLMAPPRGWHLHEKHVEIDGRFVSGSQFDFGLDLFPTWRAGSRAPAAHPSST
jgi:malate synthase